MHKTFHRRVLSPRNVIVVVAIAGVIGTIYGLSVSHPYTATLPPLVTLGALAAAFLHRRSFSFSTVSPAVPKRLLISVYVLLVALVVGTFTLNPGYSRAFPTHVLLLALYVLTVFALFALDSGPLHLSLLLTTGVLHRTLIYYNSATQLGLDALFHTRMAARISATGSLEPLAAASSKYWYAPLYHLTVAVTSTLSGLSVRDAAFVGIAVVATVLPVLVVYCFLYPFWGKRVAGLGAFLLLVADRAISYTVHLTPTTLGFVLFSVALFASVQYLNTGDRGYYGVFLILILGQVLNHQVSLFVTIVAIGAYVGTRVLWRGEVTGRDVAFAPILAVAGLYQGFATKVNGPSGELTLADVAIRNFRRGLESGGGATVSQLPAGADVVVANTSSLSSVHVLGLAILFGLSVVGAVYWISEIENTDRDFVFVLCGTAVVMSVFVFVPPLIGIQVLFSHRWILFLSLFLAVLAAPGVAALLTWGTSPFRSSQRKQVVALVLVLLVVVAPYAALMSWNYPGALDGPVFDSSPGAQRLTATPTEVATYRHVDQYGSGASVFADKAARQMIERRYGHPAADYQIEYGSSQPVETEDVLIVDRAYARTKHAQYSIKYRSRWFPVFGPLPVERSRYSVVYSAGEDRILYRG